MTSVWKTLQWSGKRNETFMSSSGEKTPPPVWELSWEPPVYMLTGGYIDLVSSFEVDYGWDVVCITW